MNKKLILAVTALLCLTPSALRAQEEVFLDDMTVKELEAALHTPVRIVEQGGDCLLSAVIGGDKQREHKRRQMYEQTDRSSGGPSERREVDPV